MCWPTKKDVVFEQGRVHLLPAPGDATLHQGRHGPDGAKHAAHDVVDAAASAQRIAGAPGHVGQATHHLHHFIQRCAVLVRTGQKAGVVHVDEAGVDLRQRGVIQPVLGHHAGLEVLRHHVGGCGQLAGHLQRFWVAQIQRNAFLVAVEHGEEARTRAEQVAGAVALHGLDLDDLGPQIRQHHAACGAHDHVGEFNDPKARQGQGAFRRFGRFGRFGRGRSRGGTCHGRTIQKSNRCGGLGGLCVAGQARLPQGAVQGLACQPARHAMAQCQ